MRLRCSRTVMYVCWAFIVASVVIQTKFLFSPRSKMAYIDAMTNVTLNISHFGGGSGSDVIIADVPEPVYAKSPIYHVNFLKVHKAGSTTMQNLMFRLGLRHNLTILLPRQGNYLLGRGSAMPVKKGGHFDIFACHTVFSKNVYGLLPEDTVNIGIIRDPLTRTISAAYYYRDVFGTGYLKRIPGENFIESLVSSPEKYDNGMFSYTKNSMGKDFGFSPGLQNQKEKIEHHLDYLKATIRIVMVMERFEESLVLLKRTLDWSLQDILFLQSNSHPHKDVNLSNDQVLKFKQTSFLDYAIYDGFYPIFEAKIAAEGPGFQEEVAYFRSILLKVKEFCTNVTVTIVSALQVPESKWNQPMEVSKRDCELMTKDEMNFIKEIRARHNAMQ